MTFVWTVTGVLTVALYAAMSLAMLVYVLTRVVRAWLCKHDRGVWHTPACNAVCNKCGVNLGSIDTWRQRENAQCLDGEPKA